MPVWQQHTAPRVARTQPRMPTAYLTRLRPFGTVTTHSRTTEDVQPSKEAKILSEYTTCPKCGIDFDTLQALDIHKERGCEWQDDEDEFYS